MAVRELLGVLLVSLAALSFVAVFVLKAMLNRLGMPYFPLAGIAYLLLAVATAGLIAHRRVQKQVSGRRWKWVWLRGLCGCLNLLLQLLALSAGAPLGDVSTLSSLSVVVSALLGKLLLGESLGCLQVLAMCLSLSGACLVSHPAMMTSTHAAQAAARGGDPWLGYLLAAASSFASGSLFITSRKLRDISPLMGTCSACLQCGLGIWLVFFIGLAPEPPVDSVVARPELAAVAMLLMVGAVFGTAIGLSAGSQMCPAAISATVWTSSTMSTGYAAQVLVLSQAPEALTICGAVMMFLAVALIGRAAARSKSSPAPEKVVETMSEVPTAAEPHASACAIAVEEEVSAV